MSKVFFGPRASMTDRFLGFARLKTAAVTLGSICLFLGAITQQACASTPTTTTLTVTSGGTAVTAVMSGSVVTLTAAVKAGGAPVAPGRVNFCDAAAKYCTDIHLLGSAQLTSAGTATMKFIPGIGSHQYTAVFVGTKTNAASTSNVSTLTVAGQSTSSTGAVTTIAQSGSVGNYTLTATVTGVGLVSPTGPVSFLDTSNANYVLGKANLGPGPTGLSFFNSSTLAASNSPESIASADFNGDGIPDLAVGSIFADKMNVFLGNGDGTFKPAPDVLLSGASMFVAAGDFNGDGIPDLAILANGSSSLIIMQGIGDGTFTAVSTPPVGRNAESVTVGDFNGDGNLDIAVANTGGNSVTILLGNGDGTFVVGSTLTSSGDPDSIAVGDFNCDGNMDLAVSNYVGNTITVLLGNGDGTFTAAHPLTTGTNPTVVVAADFNGDGKLDLAVSNLDSNTVIVFMGNGDGTFTATPQNLVTGDLPYFLVVGDFNGDGNADLVATNFGMNTMTLLLGSGDGNFQTSATALNTGSAPDATVVADFNGDGLPDIAVANGHDNTVSVLLTQWTGVRSATVSGISPVGTGTHDVDASYAGDPDYNGSISSTTPLTAEPATTTLNLSANPRSGTVGQLVEITAALDPDTAQDHSATGTVTFYSNGADIGTGTVTNSVATLDLTTLTVGTNNLTATYAGDTNFAMSTSGPLPFPVIPHVPQTGLVEPVGTTSATQTATITLTANGTLGTISVLTQGASNLDFNFFLGGTCTPGITYTTGQTCTVLYTFTPMHPGMRYGGITLTTSSGSLLANSYISGTGTGPQVTYRPGTQTTLASGFSEPNGTAVDGNGNIFVADEGNNAVKEILAAGGYTTVNTLGSGFGDPIGVAVDGSGNVFVADATHHAVKEIVAAEGYTTINTLLTGTSLEPVFLVVDGAGNVFFSEGSTHVVMEILAAGGYTTVNTIYNVPASVPSGLALDGSGNLYISDLNNTVVAEALAASGYTTVIGLGGGIQSGYGVAVDASGAVYVAEPLIVNGDVKRIPPGCVTAACVVTLALNLSHPAGLAMDGSGNIYIGDQGNNRVVKLDYTVPPSLTFATTAVGSTSSDSPQTVTLTNSGNTNLSFTGPSTGTNPTITPGFAIGGSSTCPQLSPNSSGATLAPGITCTDVISFVPVAPGLDSGRLITTDDNLNVPGATQIILLNGTGTGVVPTVTGISPNSGPTAGGTVVTISGTNFLGVSTVSFGAAAATSFTVNSASSMTAISPAGAGTVDVTVTTSSGVSAPNASDQFTYVPPQPQTITFVQSPTAYAGTSVSLVATGGASGNPVVFSVVRGPASVSGVNGSTLTFTRQGTVVVAANQAGSATYSPASTVQNTVTVTTLTEPVGTTSPAVTTVVTFGTTGTLAAINVLTQGKANLDFNSVAGGDCAIGTTYAAGQTCTVEFSFTPTHPGLRYGGMTLTTSSGVALANSYIYGIGIGPQIIWQPGTQSLIGSGLNTPSGVAVDGSGNVFVSDEQNNAVEEISATDGSTRTLGTFALPDDIAVDGSGNVFVISNRTTLSEILAVNGTIPASPTILTLSTAFLSLNGMKVDGNGNVFLASSFFDGEDSAVQEVLAVNGSITASPTILTLVSGIGGPTGVAVDASGNVFFSDEVNGAVDEVLAVNGSIPASPTVVTLGTGFSEPTNVALDGSGNVFVPEIGPNAVQEILAVNGSIPTSPTILTLGTGITEPEGLFIDAGGNVFVADAALTQIVKLDYADPPSLTFASTPVGSTSTDSPQTVTITNDGNANLTFPPPSNGNNPSITAGFTIGSSSTCPQLTASSGPATLPTGHSCTDVISFTPVTAGLDSGALITTDDNRNVAGANQIVPLNGFGIAPSVTTLTVSPNPAIFGTAVTMTATVTTASSSPTTPTGTVTFFDNGTAIGTQTLAGGAATLTLSTLPVGPDTITCTYSGDSNFTPSTCNAVVVHITADPSALTIATSINPSPALTPVTFTAHFTINGKPAGTGNAVMFSVTPQSGAPTLTFPATTDATGAATFTPSGLYPGVYLVSVAYPATMNVLASSAGPITETVNLNPTTTTLTASPTPGFQNQPVTFVATVTALAGTAPPNGTVTLLDGTATIATIPAVLGNGAFSTATLTFSTGVIGSHSFTAIYTPLAGNSGIAITSIPFGTSGGALSFLASQSAAFSLTILPQDFSLTANPPSITIETQHHGTMQLTLTSIGGFTGPITLTCGTALPPWVTCEPPTSPTLLAANATTPVNLTLDTDQLPGFLSYARPQAPASHVSTLSRIALAMLLPLTLLGLGRRRKPLRSLLMMASLVALMSALTACGGNKYPNHTPPGVYTIPITATGTAVGSSTPITHTLNITLTVTP